MNIPGPGTILFTAAALAMDAFAVSLSAGLLLRGASPWRILRLPLAFGLFQAAMPVLGGWAGSGFRTRMAAWDHWIAFGLLAAVGGHMLLEAFRPRERQGRPDPSGWPALLVLAVATSIDALAVGAGFSLAGYPVLSLALAAGVVTFALSFLAVYIGDRIGNVLETGADALGGIILIGIGFRILLSHIG